MKLKYSVTSTIEFSVKAFWAEEGGMGYDEFGEKVKTLEEAVELLRMAKIVKSNVDWIIVAHVDEKTER